MMEILFKLTTILCFLSYNTYSLNYGSFLNRNGNNNIQNMKTELLTLSRKVNKGLLETPEDRMKIMELFDKIEKYNKRNSTLTNDDLNAVWSLEYTTSDSILDRKGAPKIGISQLYI